MRIKSIPYSLLRMLVLLLLLSIFFFSPFFFFFFLSFISDAPDNENRNYEYRREYILINLFRPLIFFIIHLSCTIFELLACDPLFLWWYSQWQYNIIFDRSQTMTTHNKFNQYIYIYSREIDFGYNYSRHCIFFFFFQTILLFPCQSLFYLHLEFIFFSLSLSLAWSL